MLTEATRSAVASLHAFTFRERGRVQLRSVAEPVLLFGALRRGVVSTHDLPIDPVCRMAVDPESAAGSLQYRGTVFIFGSLDCAGRFAAEPERYAR